MSGQELVGKTILSKKTVYFYGEAFFFISSFASPVFFLGFSYLTALLVSQPISWQLTGSSKADITV